MGFNMDKDKAQALDGFALILFQECWDIIKEDLLLIIFLFSAPRLECYGNYYLLFLVFLGSCLIRLEIPLVGGVDLIWARSA